MNKSDITIVIPHYDGEMPNKALEICLRSLQESDFPMNQVVVAYNGMFGGFRAQEYKVLWIEEQGQCKAVNAAVAITSTPWVMVSNNDMVYPKNWFERLTEPIQDDYYSRGEADRYRDLENVYCLSPQLIEPRSGAPTFKTVFCGGLGGDWDEKKFKDYAEDHVGVGIQTGFNLPFLVKKEVWDMVGGYDIQYDPWSSNSDSDFEYKLKLAGIQPFQNTDCPVYHFSQTSGTFEPKNQSYWQKNWDYFIQKWGFPRTDDGIWQASFTISMDQLKYHPKWEGFYSRETAVVPQNRVVEE